MKSTIINDELVHNDSVFHIQFTLTNNFSVIPKNLVNQVYGVCFYDNKIVLGFNDSKKWSLLGGKPEQNESYIDTLRREIKEESNMQLLQATAIGYQYVVEENKYQLRYACLVTPFGPFVKDPAGGILKLSFVEPNNTNSYLQWGKIGDELIKQAQASLKSIN